MLKIALNPKIEELFRSDQSYWRYWISQIHEKVKIINEKMKNPNLIYFHPIFFVLFYSADLKNIFETLQMEIEHCWGAEVKQIAANFRFMCHMSLLTWQMTLVTYVHIVKNYAEHENRWIKSLWLFVSYPQNSWKSEKVKIKSENPNSCKIHAKFFVFLSVMYSADLKIICEL